MTLELPDCAVCAGSLITIKKQFDFKIEDIPFRTKQKYERQQCIKCGEEYIAADVATLMDKEFAEARAYIEEQDRTYKVTDTGPIVKINGYVDSEGYDAPASAKQWQTGYIHYLRQVVTQDKVSIIPASQAYNIYCNDEDRLSVAAKQFIKPDDYFKLTSIS